MNETGNKFLLETEIQALQQKLEEKKRALQMESENALHEKDVFREVLKEHIEQVPEDIDIQNKSGIKMPIPSPVPAGQANDKDVSEHADVVEALVHIAFRDGILKAVQAARETQSPYVVDALHDKLVDEYYDKLLAARQVESN